MAALHNFNNKIFVASSTLFTGKLGRYLEEYTEGLTLRGFFRSISEWMLSSLRASPTRLFLRTWRTKKGLLASRGSKVRSMKTFCRLAPLTATWKGTSRTQSLRAHLRVGTASCAFQSGVCGEMPTTSPLFCIIFVFTFPVRFSKLLCLWNIQIFLIWTQRD